MSKNKIIRMTMGGILLAMALAAGVSVYQVQTEETAGKENLTAENTESVAIDKKVLEMPENDTGAQEENTETAADTSQTTDAGDAATVETAADDVQAQTEENMDKTQKNTGKTQETARETAAGVSQSFTENSVISWPVEGTILLDYSMDETTYFSTLNVYKCNPAILLKAEVGDAVNAAYAGTVTEVFTSEETGDTVVVDMGNGYEATYGQLKEITVKKGDSVQKGTQLGTVCEPTKYYKNEGTNLYFGMTKDNQPVDPAMYTTSLTE